MKGSENFKKTIEDHLNGIANKDELFAGTLMKESKNIDDCITYIMNTVHKSGANGFEDEEIYQMAIHYYDEDDIDIGGANSGSVVVNHKVELTEKEISDAKQKALDDIISEEKKKKLSKAEKKRSKSLVINEDLTLF
ncbi:MAG: hypothetical protein ACJASM_003066 [Salibacteraceae bacterium]|jgi:hypothetical protein